MSNKYCKKIIVEGKNDTTESSLYRAIIHCGNGICWQTILLDWKSKVCLSLQRENWLTWFDDLKS